MSHDLSKAPAGRKKLAIEDINVWFISVDPNRDTAQKRLQYINYFNPNYQAVSGPHKALYPFVQNLGLIYAVTEEQTGDYLVDHSASVALVDPHGKIRLSSNLNLKLAVYQPLIQTP